MPHVSVLADQRMRLLVSSDLIGLSFGVEDIVDLCDELSAGLA